MAAQKATTVRRHSNLSGWYTPQAIDSRPKIENWANRPVGTKTKSARVSLTTSDFESQICRDFDLIETSEFDTS